MDVVDRLTPSTDIKTTLEGLKMPFTAVIVFQILFVILNLIDGKDDSVLIIFLPISVGFILMAVLLSFWIGIVTIKEGGNIGDALVGSAILGFVYGLFTSFFQEMFTDGDYFKDTYIGKAYILNILTWTVLFVMLAFVGAGLMEDMTRGDSKSAKKPAKKPAKKAAKKPAKKAAKKAAKAEEG